MAYIVVAVTVETLGRYREICHESILANQLPGSLTCHPCSNEARNSRNGPRYMSAKAYWRRVLHAINFVAAGDGLGRGHCSTIVAPVPNQPGRGYWR
jgi:hypothetical protein